MTNNNYSEIELKYFSYIAEHSVSNAVEKEKIKSKMAMKINNPSSQYCGIIYYYKVIFKNPVKIKNDKDVKDVKVIKGFHIMPYRINAEDMEKAEKQSKKKDFNKRVTDKNHKDYNSQLVDYDEGSGNFHKVPDGEFQVVLLDTTAKPDGPGKINDDERTKNSYMYFPNPTAKKAYHGNDPAKLIKDAMEYLKENEKKE